MTANAILETETRAVEPENVFQVVLSKLICEELKQRPGQLLASARAASFGARSGFRDNNTGLLSKWRPLTLSGLLQGVSSSEPNERAAHSLSRLLATTAQPQNTPAEPC